VTVRPEGALPTSRDFGRLDEARILETIARLEARIGERFPGSGLQRVAGAVLAQARETAGLVAAVRRPNWPIRAAVGLLIVLMLAVVAVIALSLHLPAGVDGIAEFVQGVEAALSALVLLGATVFFLATLEVRLKRHRVLRSLHRLRSMAHIVDMHQLTKDPELLSAPRADTPSSPVRTLTAPELGRYLDYCGELLSLISKLAAIHVAEFDDPVALAAVNDIEALTTGLASKIWQKITLLDRSAAGAP
jgi:hypothetical protein